MIRFRRIAAWLACGWLLQLAATAAWGAQYLGCFKDDRWQRDLGGYTTNFPTMTGAACVELCRGKGFRFAATQYAQHCFCGNDYGKLGPATNCDMKCGGNPAETCGGNSANSVYAVAGSSPAAPAPAPAQPTAAPAAPAVPPAAAGGLPPNTRYLGCYRDGRWQRDLPGFTTNSPTMTTRTCVDLCRGKGFALAATQYAQHCFCGNEYGRYGTAPNCNMKCAGNPGEICGGDLANSVYALSGAAAPVQPPPAPPAAPPATPPAAPAAPVATKSLTGAWVHSSVGTTATPDSLVIIIQDGSQVDFVQSYKMAANRNQWQTLRCTGPLAGNQLRLQCRWAPGGDPMGYGGPWSVVYTVSDDRDHLDGVGKDAHHYSRRP